MFKNIFDNKKVFSKLPLKTHGQFTQTNQK